MDSYKLVLFLSLTLRLCDSVDDSKSIAGYGVEFVKRFQLQNTVSKWQHAFVFPLSDLNVTIERDTNKAGFCPISGTFDKDITGCVYYHSSFDAITAHADLTLREILQYKSIIKWMTYPSDTKRDKRGLFDAIGIGLKKLFSVSVEDDDARLQNEINTTVKPVCNDHLCDKIYYLWYFQYCVLIKTEGTNLLLLAISALWSSSRWPLAT